MNSENYNDAASCEDATSNSDDISEAPSVPKSKRKMTKKNPFSEKPNVENEPNYNNRARINTLRMASRSAYARKAWSVAESHYKELLAILIAANYHVEPDTLHELGNVMKYQGKLNEAKNYYFQEIAYYQKIEEDRFMAEPWRELGIIAHTECRWDEAKLCYEKALKSDIDRGYRTGQSATLIQLASLMEEQSKWGRVEEYLQQALGISESLGESDSQMRALLLLSISGFGRLIKAQKKLSEVFKE